MTAPVSAAPQTPLLTYIGSCFTSTSVHKAPFQRVLKQKERKLEWQLRRQTKERSKQWVIWPPPFQRRFVCGKMKWILALVLNLFSCLHLLDCCRMLPDTVVRIKGRCGVDSRVTEWHTRLVNVFLAVTPGHFQLLLLTRTAEPSINKPQHRSFEPIFL